MQLFHRVAELRAWRAQQAEVAFVPTMGNLHDGHMALMTAARQQAERVVVSIFVNPTQFDREDDLARYPRTLEADLQRCREAGVDAVFAPDVDDMYPHGVSTTTVDVGPLAQRLEGASRPGHFAGVATVVSKLFHCVQPDVALFGRKDYQQLLVIQRMVDDLNFPLRILGLETVRDERGLALSSRNAYLTAEEWAIAPGLYAQLQEAKARIQQGERDLAAIQQQLVDGLDARGFRVDRVDICRAADLAQASENDSAWVLLAAAWLGRARLIDNLLVELTDG